MRPIISEPQAVANAPLLDRIVLVAGDFVAQDVDAIVAVIPPTLEIKDGPDAAILAAAGPELDKAILETIYRPRAGDVFALPGCRLKARHVIFGVIPDWRTEFECEDRHLLGCYRASVQLAASMGLISLAFPGLFLPGHKGFPPRRAVRLAIKGIMDRLGDPIREVRIACPSADLLETYRKRLAEAGWVGSAPPSA